MVLESTIQKNILNWLNDLPFCRAVIYTAHAMGNRGHPDIYGCLAGRAFFIEVKQPGKEPTDQQAAEIRKWQKSGAIAGSATSVEEARLLLLPLLREFGMTYLLD